MLTVESIIILLQPLFVCYIFVIRSRYCRQIFGTAMESLVSVTMANLVMEEIDKKALSTFNPQPRFWIRYVDDAITVVETEQI